MSDAHRHAKATKIRKGRCKEPGLEARTLFARCMLFYPPFFSDFLVAPKGRKCKTRDGLPRHAPFCGRRPPEERRPRAARDTEEKKRRRPHIREKMTTTGKFFAFLCKKRAETERKGDIQVGLRGEGSRQGEINANIGGGARRCVAPVSADADARARISGKDVDLVLDRGV